MQSIDSLKIWTNFYVAEFLFICFCTTSCTLSNILGATLVRESSLIFVHADVLKLLFVHLHCIACLHMRTVVIMMLVLFLVSQTKMKWYLVLVFALVQTKTKINCQSLTLIKQWNEIKVWNNGLHSNFTVWNCRLLSVVCLIFNKTAIIVSDSLGTKFCTRHIYTCSLSCCENNYLPKLYMVAYISLLYVNYLCAEKKIRKYCQDFHSPMLSNHPLIFFLMRFWPIVYLNPPIKFNFFSCNF